MLQWLGYAIVLSLVVLYLYKQEKARIMDPDTAWYIVKTIALIGAGIVLYFGGPNG